MHATDPTLAAWLERVGLEEAPPPTLAGLARLHRAQLLHIPFENLDILFGRGIDLAPDNVADKLITRRRGGYCFELNGLYCRMLQAVGFDARLLLARVLWGAEGIPPRIHALCLVTVGDVYWLSDVGFGAHSMRYPLALVDGATLVTDDQRLRLQRDPEHGWRLEGIHEGAWQVHYVFDLARVYPADIALGNHYTSTGTHTHFTRIATLARLTPEGRVTLRDRLVARYASGRTEKEMAYPASLPSILAADFGIEPAASEEEWARYWRIVDGEAHA